MKDGGLVFPIDTRKTDPDGTVTGTVHFGMTVRDWFAGMAMQALLASPHSTFTSGIYAPDLARLAYQFADAMLDRKL